MWREIIKHKDFCLQNAFGFFHHRWGVCVRRGSFQVLFNKTESAARERVCGYVCDYVWLTFVYVVPTDIFLKSFHVPPEELKDKLLIINEDDGGLSDEHIASLRR